LRLYRLLVQAGPVSTGTLAAAADTSIAQIEGMLSRWPGVYRADDGRIIGYGGLTVDETKHRMHIDGSVRYTWCAWDTLFIPQLLGAAARIESSCAATGEPVVLNVHPDGVEAAGGHLGVSLVAPDPAHALGDIVGHFCCHVKFFASERVGRKWEAKHPGTFLATLDQAWQLGRRHNALRYPRFTS
jgi:alkylmercury lyase